MEDTKLRIGDVVKTVFGVTGAVVGSVNDWVIVEHNTGLAYYRESEVGHSTCPICNTIDLDGLEACSGCYMQVVTELAKVKKENKALRETIARGDHTI